MNFQQVKQTRLYVPETPVTAGYICFYRTAAQEAAALYPIDKLWSEAGAEGYFLFLENAPADAGALAAAIAAYRTGPGNKLPDVIHSSFAWISYVDEPAAIRSVIPMQVLLSEAAAVVSEDVYFNAGACTMKMLKDFRVELDLVGNSFRFTYPASLPAIVNTARQVNLFFNGGACGCWSSQVTIADFNHDAATGWSAQLMYSYPEENVMQHVRYPLFAGAAGVQTLFTLQLDPLQPVGGRTQLLFDGASFQLAEDPDAPGGYRIEMSSAVLPVYLQTVYGEAISILPLTTAVTGAGPARLVQDVASKDSDGNPLSYYWAPAGDFELALTSGKNDGEARSLLCGLSGSEFCSFIPKSTSAPGDIISFWPYKNACAVAYPLFGPDVPPTFSPPSELLHGDFTTSWVSIWGNAAGRKCKYAAQPEGAVLYGGKPHDMGAVGKLLPSQDVYAANLFPGTAPIPFPLAPVKGFDKNVVTPAFISRFETQIINPSRRKAIGPAKDEDFAEAFTEGTEQTTTPQGLLVEINGLQWTKLLLAKNKDKGGNAEELCFRSLNPVLQGAFQSNQLFLVVSDQRYFKEGTTVFESAISIEGWPFNLGQKESEEGIYKNILLFKYCDGSLLDRIRDIRSWSNANEFNGGGDNNLLLLSNWIQAYLNVPQDNPNYSYFGKIIADPNWRGILALNVEIGLQDFPPELQGLLAGIDLNRFSAHHFGIETNHVEVKEDGLKMNDRSSMFGLIDYNDTGGSGSGDYDFRTLSLQVLFSNSAIVNFSSRIRLTMKKILGSEIIAGGDALELQGVYEDHGGFKSYVFNLVEQREYETNNAVLKSVGILKAAFLTVKAADESGGSGQEVVSRFSFWGTIAFYELMQRNKTEDEEVDPVPVPLDLFSFDALSYANLELNMQFVLNDPANKTFGLDSSAMAFDISSSIVRRDSLFRKFPIQIRALLIGNGQKPGDLGYIAMRTNADMNSLRDNWHALQFDLNFGSPGSLAEKVGFTASVLTAWSPDASAKASAAVMLRLPGGTGRRELSLQGALTLSADSYELQNYTDADDARNMAFMIAMKNMGLNLFGFRIPPGFGTNVTLFGNPDAEPNDNTLGWYLSYLKKASANAPAALQITEETMPVVKKRAVKKISSKKKNK